MDRHWRYVNTCQRLSQYIYITQYKKSIHFKHIVLFINIWRGFCGRCFPTQSSPVIIYITVTAHHTTACLISALLLQQLVFHTSIEKCFLLPYKGNTPLNKKLTCPSYDLKTRVLVCYNHVWLFSIDGLVLYRFLLWWDAKSRILLLKFCFAGLLGLASK